MIAVGNEYCRRCVCSRCNLRGTERCLEHYYGETKCDCCEEGSERTISCDYGPIMAIDGEIYLGDDCVGMRIYPLNEGLHICYWDAWETQCSVTIPWAELDKVRQEAEKEA